MYRKEDVLRGEGMKEGKTSGVKTFLELARPLTSAYVCLCGHRERAHPAPSAAINRYFQQLQWPPQLRGRGCGPAGVLLNTHESFQGN